MTITEIVNLSVAKITHLEAQKTQAIQIGNIEQIIALENQIAETQNTLAALKTLL